MARPNQRRRSFVLAVSCGDGKGGDYGEKISIFSLDIAPKMSIDGSNITKTSRCLALICPGKIMKNHNRTSWIITILGLIGLAVAPRLTVGQEVVNRFDTAGEAGQWRFDFGIGSTSWSWDPTLDSLGNAASGSLKVTIPFQASLGFNNKAALTTDRWYPGLNGASYTSLDFDIRIDPDSAPDAFGLNGYFTMAIRNTDNYNYIQQFGDNVGVSWMVNMPNGWRHVSVPLTGPYDHIRALTFQLYGGPSQNIDGPVTFNLDNIVFVPEPSSAAIFGLGALGLFVIRRHKRSAR